LYKNVAYTYYRSTYICQTSVR